MYPGPDDPLRVAYLSYRGKPHVGGQGVYTRHLTKALVDLGHTVDVLGGQPYPVLDERVRLTKLPSLDIFNDQYPGRFPAYWEIRHLGDVVEILQFSAGTFSEPLAFSVRAWQELKRRPDQFDLVHDNQSLGYGLLAIEKQLPTIVTLHHPITVDRRLEMEHAPTWRKRVSVGRWYSFVKMQARVARQMPRIVVVSENSIKDIHGDMGVETARMRLVPVGVDPDLFRPRPDVQRIPGRLITTASADVTLKGLSFLLEALAKLRTEQDVTLTVIGRPKAGGRAEEAIERLGLSGAITWVSGVTDEQIVELYAEASLAVVPSLYEGFSLPAVEAMSTGICLVATTGGALPEVTGPDNDTVLSCPPGDVDALVRTIARGLADPALRSRIGAAGRQRVAERWSWRHCAQLTVDQYREVLAMPENQAKLERREEKRSADEPEQQRREEKRSADEPEQQRREEKRSADEPEQQRREEKRSADEARTGSCARWAGPGPNRPGRTVLMLTVRYALLGLEPGDTLLDLGCGFGRHAYEAAKRGASVVAFDYADNELKEVRNTFGAMAEAGEVGPASLAGAVQGDGTRLPFADGAFDRVIASEVLEHILDDQAALDELARVLRPGGTMAVTVPAWLPEKVCWALSDEYHAPFVEGGHVRIYRAAGMRTRMLAAGLEPRSSHRAHALHAPYWWLRCAVGPTNDDHRAVAAYRKILEWDIMKAPKATRWTEQVLNPVLGKSLVVYAREASMSAPDVAGLLPEVDDVLTADEVAHSAESIAALQLPCGMIPWFPGGHCDPWNHVETAMALSVAGRLEEASQAYEWLLRTQRPDGSWFNYYVQAPDGASIVVEDTKLDTNVCAYVATGVWHHWLITQDRGFVERLWPTVRRAVDWVLSMQTERGEIVWAREVDERPWTYALLTGSSSIYHALDCALALAEVVGSERPRWELALAALGRVIRSLPHAFEPKERWAMDWYYPVLCNVLEGIAAEQRLAGLWGMFVMPGLGVRCVSDEPWVTAAETAECAIAHAAAGDKARATELLSWTRAHRHEDGSYWTGIVHPEGVRFPAGERTAYTAAAVILAADAISGTSAASDVFIPATSR